MTRKTIEHILNNHSIGFEVIEGQVIAEDVAYNRNTDLMEVEPKLITGMSKQELKGWLGY